MLKYHAIKNGKIIFSLASVFLMLSTGCSKSVPKPDDANARTLVVAQTGADTNNLNPALCMGVTGTNLVPQIFDAILINGPGNKPEPNVASSFEVSPDYTKVTLKIRDNIKFHDGSPLTAADVKYSLERYMKPDSQTAQNIQRYVERVDQPNKDTIIVYLNAPYPFILSNLEGIRVMPSQFIKEKGEEYFNTHPIGSGPYKLVEIDPNSSVIYEANENYWKGVPEFKKLIILDIPDASTRVSMLKSGEADLVPLNLSDIPSIEAIAGLHIKNIKQSRMTTIYVQGAWEDRGEASQNLLVRQAMDYAINRQEIINDFFDGYATPEKYWKVSPIGENWDPSWKPVDYNPERAKQLLKEANYPADFKYPTIRFYTQPERSYQIKLTELIASYWTEVGLQVQIIQSDTNALNALVRGTNGLVDEAYGAVFIWTSPLGLQDGISSQYIFYHSKGYISINRANPYTDELFDKGLTELDLKKRNEIDNEILGIIADQNKYSFGLVYVDDLWGASAKVGRWKGDDELTDGSFSGLYYETIKAAK
jgi:peptide/nickel transport system substrate-binding protein